MRRDVFDVDKGTLQLHALISNECRDEIIQAVANGITRWHILDKNNATEQARDLILMSMNKDVYNYPVSIIPTT